MDYHIPIVPYDLETFKEGLFGAILVGISPFVFFWVLSRIFPVLGMKDSP
jgi:hypothetical protein